MIEPRLTYRGICDSCGMTAGTFDERTFPGPQDVTVQLIEKLKWTAFEEIHHCFRCPPLCPDCGKTDCLSLTQEGDCGYVSREPSVIAPLARGGAHGQG